jgi:hypothetical protein
MPERQRAIFGPYWNGAASVHGDPVAISRRFAHACGGREDDVFRDLKSDVEPVAFAAWQKFMDATRDAFQLVPFNEADGTGAMEADCLDVWEAFTEWKAKKKAAPANSPICSPPMAPAF